MDSECRQMYICLFTLSEEGEGVSVDLSDFGNEWGL